MDGDDESGYPITDGRFRWLRQYPVAASATEKGDRESENGKRRPIAHGGDRTPFVAANAAPTCIFVAFCVSPVRGENFPLDDALRHS